MGGGLRVITLEKGSSTALAEEIARIIRERGKNKVNIIIPGTAESNRRCPRSSTRSSRTTQPRRRAASRRATTRTRTSSRRCPTGRRTPRPTSSRRRPAQRSRPQPDAAPKPGEPAPVTITVVGNKLFVSSDDPEALQLAGELYRLLTQSPGEGDFKVIRLKNANATETARILDEVFNGPRQQQQGGRNQGGRNQGNQGGGGRNQGGGGGIRSAAEAAVATTRSPSSSSSPTRRPSCRRPRRRTASASSPTRRPTPARAGQSARHGDHPQPAGGGHRQGPGRGTARGGHEAAHDQGQLRQRVRDLDPGPESLPRQDDQLAATAAPPSPERGGGNRPRLARPRPCPWRSTTTPTA